MTKKELADKQTAENACLEIIDICRKQKNFKKVKF